MDYNDLLAQQGIDFVVIGTPDHQHKPNLLAALAAGKDVYQEKPLSLSLDESDQMIQAVRRTKQIVQIGMQRRSMPFIYRAKSLIDEGMLGKISMVKAKWNWNFNLPLDNAPLAGALDCKSGARRGDEAPARANAVSMVAGIFGTTPGGT